MRFGVVCLLLFFADNDDSLLNRFPVGLFGAILDEYFDCELCTLLEERHPSSIIVSYFLILFLDIHNLQSISFFHSTR